MFIAEGTREVERALAAGLAPRGIYVAPELLPEWTRAGAEEVSATVLAKMAYRAEPEGLLGVFEEPKRALSPDATLVLVAVNIEKPGNLGAMARTADAAGVDALLVAGPNFDPWNPNSIRASTGAVFTLPIVEATLADVDNTVAQEGRRRRRGDASTHGRRLHRPDRLPHRRRGRRSGRCLARARRLGGRDSDERNRGGLAEREHRRRRSPLRGRAPARSARPDPSPRYSSGTPLIPVRLRFGS